MQITARASTTMHSMADCACCRRTGGRFAVCTWQRDMFIPSCVIERNRALHWGHPLRMIVCRIPGLASSQPAAGALDVPEQAAGSAARGGGGRGGAVGIEGRVVRGGRGRRCGVWRRRQRHTEVTQVTQLRCVGGRAIWGVGRCGARAGRLRQLCHLAAWRRADAQILMEPQRCRVHPGRPLSLQAAADRALQHLLCVQERGVVLLGPARLAQALGRVWRGGADADAGGPLLDVQRPRVDGVVHPARAIGLVDHLLQAGQKERIIHILVLRRRRALLPRSILPVTHHLLQPLQEHRVLGALKLRPLGALIFLRRQLRLRLDVAHCERHRGHLQRRQHIH
mmetsp:Transcript_31508/g.81522  ORF Transcript_31508/g.81522 Transcript_31508/m.81522 type:complete len:339 (-) Transcript_31508:783-1799(-)